MEKTLEILLENTQAAALASRKHLIVCAGIPPPGSGIFVRHSGYFWGVVLLWYPAVASHAAWAGRCQRIVRGEARGIPAPKEKAKPGRKARRSKKPGKIGKPNPRRGHSAGGYGVARALAQPKS